MKSTRYSVFLALVACALTTVAFTAEARAQARKPNIVVIWGDDTGRSNVSTYTHGMMGYRTPNIDRIAREGVFFALDGYNFISTQRSVMPASSLPRSRSFRPVTRLRTSP